MLQKISFLLSLFVISQLSFIVVANENQEAKTDILFLKIQELESEIADLRNKIESQNYLIEKLINESISENQEPADICKNMQKSNARKNADIKIADKNLQATDCRQLQQTPIYKIGGGGARAARRIQIRRPRLAERGAKACRIQCRISADSKASDGPRPTRRPAREVCLLPTLGPKTSDFWQTFGESKIH